VISFEVLAIACLIKWTTLARKTDTTDMARIALRWMVLLDLLLGMDWASMATKALAQENQPPPSLRELSPSKGLVSLGTPKPLPREKPFSINLPTALSLANAQPIDIALASEALRAASAQLDRANVLWLPNIVVGPDYYRHDGRIQDTPGVLTDTSKSSFMVGAGPVAVFQLSDALFEPLAARQVVRARQADLEAAANDSVLAVAEAYFNVQQARGELAGAEDAVTRAEELVRRADKLAPGLVPPFEASRARAEAARRRQSRTSARERWQTSSADLNRLLRLDPKTIVEPLEPPQLQVTLLEPKETDDDLIPLALAQRPELASQQALVQATLERLRAERLRPLVPSVLLRGASTNPAGTLAGGVFGGGQNSSLSNFGARGDFDVQILWELQNLGFGNKARVAERRADNQQSVLALFKLQDRIAAEVVQAHAQVVSATERVAESEKGLKEALDSVEKNFEGLSQTKRLGGDVILLVVRPQEVVAAIQALSAAYADYYSAIGDANRAQFRLYRALGRPAKQVLQPPTPCLPASPPHVEPVSQAKFSLAEEVPTKFAEDR
jgi:outer membrane protein TolC